MTYVKRSAISTQDLAGTAVVDVAHGASIVRKADA
jgi:hypothetical protein